jgi:hypothetical protein
MRCKELYARVISHEIIKQMVISFDINTHTLVQISNSMATTVLQAQEKLSFFNHLCEFAPEVKENNSTI